MKFESFQQGLDYETFLAKHGTDVHRQRWRRLPRPGPAQPRPEGTSARRSRARCRSSAWPGHGAAIASSNARSSSTSPPSRRTIQLRFLDRDEHADVQQAANLRRQSRPRASSSSAKTASRSPAAAIARSAKYRAMIADQAGAACPTGITAARIRWSRRDAGMARRVRARPVDPAPVVPAAAEAQRLTDSGRSDANVTPHLSRERACLAMPNRARLFRSRFLLLPAPLVAQDAKIPRPDPSRPLPEAARSAQGAARRQGHGGEASVDGWMLDRSTSPPRRRPTAPSSGCRPSSLDRRSPSGRRPPSSSCTAPAAARTAGRLPEGARQTRHHRRRHRRPLSRHGRGAQGGGRVQRGHRPGLADEDRRADGASVLLRHRLGPLAARRLPRNPRRRRRQERSA